MLASSVAQARALDAADGVIDGHYHGNTVCPFILLAPHLCLNTMPKRGHTCLSKEMNLT